MQVCAVIVDFAANDENCKTQPSISDFRLNSTRLLKKGCLTGSLNRWTETPSLSTPTESALRCVLPLKFEVYSGLETVCYNSSYFHACFLQHYIHQVITGIDEKDEVWSRVQAKSQRCSKLGNALQKQKHR